MGSLHLLESSPPQPETTIMMDQLLVTCITKEPFLMSQPGPLDPSMPTLLMPLSKKLMVNSLPNRQTKTCQTGPKFNLTTLALIPKMSNSRVTTLSPTTPKSSTMLGMPSRTKKRVTTELSQPTSLVTATTSS